MPSIRETINQTADVFSDKLFSDPRLEAELLVRHILGFNQTELYLQLEHMFPINYQAGLQLLIERRLNHEPSAYITEQKEFFGLQFYVNRSTLIPRPETEILVEQVLKIANKTPLKPLHILDIGTGSGAIAIALAVNLQHSQIIATDVSDHALSMAKRNCISHRVVNRIQLVQCDLCDPIVRGIDIIVANLPYVRLSEKNILSAGISKYEPATALYGGEDGLLYISRLLQQSPTMMNSGGSILIEISPSQVEGIRNLSAKYLPGSPVEIIPDLSGLDRVVAIQTTSEACIRCSNICNK